MSQSEYKVKIRATLPGLLFDKVIEGVEVVEAASAVVAMQKVLNHPNFIEYKEYLTILDVEKV